MKEKLDRYELAVTCGPGTLLWYGTASGEAALDAVTEECARISSTALFLVRSAADDCVTGL